MDDARADAALARLIKSAIQPELIAAEVAAIDERTWMGVLRALRRRGDSELFRLSKEMGCSAERLALVMAGLRHTGLVTSTPTTAGDRYRLTAEGSRLVALLEPAAPAREGVGA